MKNLYFVTFHPTNTQFVDLQRQSGRGTCKAHD